MQLNDALILKVQQLQDGAMTLSCVPHMLKVMKNSYAYVAMYSAGGERVSLPVNAVLLVAQ